jgi:hypothetical protein
VPSLPACLATALVQVAFGSTVPVHVSGAAPQPSPGSMVGDFVVAAPASPLAHGDAVVDLRPTALGTLSVPLPGHPVPATVHVVATLDAGDAPAPVMLPQTRPPFGWPLAIAAIIALFALLLRRRVEHRPEDPAVFLRRALIPLAEPAAWLRHDAADTVASAVRVFLSRSFRAPFAAMTTREVAAALPAHARAEHAVSFVAALELCDAVRFSGARPRPQLAADAVRGVLTTAKALTAHESAR